MDPDIDIGTAFGNGTVLLDMHSPEVAIIRLNRPERLNTMTSELVGGLHDALDVVADDNICRAVILTGNGRGFCAGLNISGFGPMPSSKGLGKAAAGMKTQQLIASLIPHMRSVTKPIIAAVNGPAAGGGFALVLGSDIRLCSESAKFGTAFVKLGLSGCDIGVSWMLPRLIGAARAHELILTGRVFDAAEADRIGLVCRVTPDAELLDAALHYASLIVGNSPYGTWMTKEVMWSNLEVSSQQAGIDLENRTQITTSFTHDLDEAMLAFLEKRKPVFTFR